MIVVGFLFGKIFSKIGDIKTFLLFKLIDIIIYYIIYIIINYMKVLLFGRHGWIVSQVYDLLINSDNHEVIIGNEIAENYTEL